MNSKYLKEADAIIIVASNGLSISEGVNIFRGDETFKKAVPEFIKMYQMSGLLDGFSRYLPENQRLDFVSRVIKAYCYDYKPSPIMKDLYALVSNKPYFVFTSNADHHFALANFDPNSIFEIEGTMKKMQCSNGCCDDTYDSKEIVEELLKHEEGFMIKEEYHKKCPKCGGSLMPNVMISRSFVQDKEYKESLQRFNDFLEKYHDKKVVVLELGVGSRNRMIKEPMMKYIMNAPLGHYYSLNLNDFYIPDALKGKATIIPGYLNETIGGLLHEITTNS